MFTIDALISDCVGRYITTPTGEIQVSCLISGRTYAEIWAALVQWANKQIVNHTTFSLTPLGVVSPVSSSVLRRDSDSQLQGSSCSSFLTLSLVLQKSISASGSHFFLLVFEFSPRPPRIFFRPGWILVFEFDDTQRFHASQIPRSHTPHHHPHTHTHSTTYHSTITPLPLCTHTHMHTHILKILKARKERQKPKQTKNISTKKWVLRWSVCHKMDTFGLLCHEVPRNFRCT